MICQACVLYDQLFIPIILKLGLVALMTKEDPGDAMLRPLQYLPRKTDWKPAAQRHL